MNSDQIKGTVKDVAGKAQRKLGEAVGSTDQQVKGALNQAEGKAQKAAGNVREAAKDLNRKI
ncbi:CsbD family protein [Roseateles cellulosilyticus]|uniref:CsbD family protein n=1 Tax=Pelomonas cellulosilytica TaxID=2906762 RepID=A0ABS8XV24_9BURK|nr:CsbD family protein [Pelomonas sp. P8]MCE4553125.1 CsbD family protein [Pelomonas sp. P8]